MKPDGKGNYHNIEVDANILKSGYGKDKLNDYLECAVREKRILYADKKYNQRNKNTPGFQLPNNILFADYDNSLADYKRIVNSQFMHKIENNSDERHSINVELKEARTAKPKYHTRGDHTSNK